jgi:hypothetical protein
MNINKRRKSYILKKIKDWCPVIIEITQCKIKLKIYKDNKKRNNTFNNKDKVNSKSSMFQFWMISHNNK